jgi:hypothetical protein
VRFRFEARRNLEAQLAGGIARNASALVEDHVRSTVEGTRCDEHGRNARLVAVRDAPGGIEFDVEGCCDELVARAKRAVTDS